MLKINKIHQGDATILLKDINDNRIDLTVTSPPYDNLRDYEGYTFNFKKIAQELYRVTKKGGVVVWVVKDEVKKGNRSLTSYRQAIFFQEIGFNIYDVIIFSKRGSSLPHKNRYFDTFEYMFVLSKGLPKTVNLLKDRLNKRAGLPTWGSRRIREKDGSLTEKGIALIPKCSIRFNIWEYTTGSNQSSRDKIAFQHPAIFPEKLAEDHILSWSNEGDLILDPLAGSGTTLKMAKKNNRRFIGIDCSPNYCLIARQRIKLKK